MYFLTMFPPASLISPRKTFNLKIPVQAFFGWAWNFTFCSKIDGDFSDILCWALDGNKKLNLVKNYFWPFVQVNIIVDAIGGLRVKGLLVLLIKEADRTLLLWPPHNSVTVLSKTTYVNFQSVYVLNQTNELSWYWLVVVRKQMV